MKNREQLFKKLDFNTKTLSAATRKNAVEFPSKYTKCVSSRKPERICERALSLTQRNERKRSFSLLHQKRMCVTSLARYAGCLCPLHDYVGSICGSVLFTMINGCFTVADLSQ